jgi:hypothetical protein
VCDASAVEILRLRTWQSVTGWDNGGRRVVLVHPEVTGPAPAPRSTATAPQVIQRPTETEASHFNPSSAHRSTDCSCAAASPLPRSASLAWSAATSRRSCVASLTVIAPPHHSPTSRSDRPSPSVIARSACSARRSESCIAESRSRRKHQVLQPALALEDFPTSPSLRMQCRSTRRLPDRLLTHHSSLSRGLTLAPPKDTANPSSGSRRVVLSGHNVFFVPPRDLKIRCAIWSRG